MYPNPLQVIGTTGVDWAEPDKKRTRGNAEIHFCIQDPPPFSVHQLKLLILSIPEYKMTIEQPLSFLVWLRELLFSCLRHVQYTVHESSNHSGFFSQALSLSSFKKNSLATDNNKELAINIPGLREPTFTPGIGLLSD